MDRGNALWADLSELKSKNYKCGYCGSDIASNEGYYIERFGEDAELGYIYICHKCNKPTYFEFEEQTPGNSFGRPFEKAIFKDESVYDLYEEARRCMSINAYTSVGMCCRKLLMHIAVDCGAKEGLKFIDYVDYLDKNSYIPINCKVWIDAIRNKGNDANHKIIILNRREAEQLISFIGMIINVIYEMPYQSKLYSDSINEND